MNFTSFSKTLLGLAASYTWNGDKSQTLVLLHVLLLGNVKNRTKQSHLSGNPFSYMANMVC